jgi:hypothetical protein
MKLIRSEKNIWKRKKRKNGTEENIFVFLLLLNEDFKNIFIAF